MAMFGGHALFIKNQKLYYVYNFLGLKPEQKLISPLPLTPGKHALGVEFVREKSGQYGESLGKAKLYVDDKVVAEGRIRTQTGHFTLCGDGWCIGYDSADKVSEEYEGRGTFTAGRILGVGIDIGKDAYLDLEKLAAAALARD
jgi:arylsulfatase